MLIGLGERKSGTDRRPRVSRGKNYSSITEVLRHRDGPAREIGEKQKLRAVAQPPFHTDCFRSEDLKCPGEWPNAGEARHDLALSDLDQPPVSGEPARM